MRIHRIGSLLGCLALPIVFLTAPVAGAQQQDSQEDIWEEESPAPMHPWWYRWLNDETMDRIMKGIEQRDPAKAKELAKLREKDIEEFKDELGQHGRQEIEQISRERFEAHRQREQADFLQWLKTNYPKEEEALSKVKEKDPQLYVRCYERLMGQYRRIFDADRSNPELGALLKEDLELRKRRDSLIQKIRSEKSEERKQALGAELQDVVSQRYDVIVRRKELAYEQLQKKLEGLQKQLQDSKAEIGKWKDPRVKHQNVQQHIESLTEGKIAFKWD